MKLLGRWVRRVCTGLGALLLLVTFTPLVPWWARALAGPWNDPSGDVLIILGGSLLDKDLIGVNSYWRSTYGTLVWRQGGFRDVIIAGGGAEETPISVPMKRFMVCYSVPPEAIHVDTLSQDTRENARETRRILEQLPPFEGGRNPRLVLLTSDYHMFRASRVFRKAGLDVQPRPFPDVIKRSNCLRCRWDGFLELVREAAKIGYYYARGWM